MSLYHHHPNVTDGKTEAFTYPIANYDQVEQVGCTPGPHLGESPWASVPWPSGICHPLQGAFKRSRDEAGSRGVQREVQGQRTCSTGPKPCQACCPHPGLLGVPCLLPDSSGSLSRPWLRSAPWTSLPGPLAKSGATSTPPGGLQLRGECPLNCGIGGYPHCGGHSHSAKERGRTCLSPFPAVLTSPWVFWGFPQIASTESSAVWLRSPGA